jgi:Transport and Golgi organisation 2
MCTVTVVPRGQGWRLVCNRDERRTRPAALSPRRHGPGGTTAIWPVDPVSGGTWIGVNEAGLAMVLLNRSAGPHTRSLSLGRSRGTIIPALLRRRQFGAALNAAASLPAGEFEPFTLLVLQGTNVGVLTNTDGGMSGCVDVLSRPLLFTSSSLGDHLVIEPRRALFARMVERGHGPPNFDRQAAFHRHRWRSRPSISVLMTRPDAATVSRTVLDADAGAVRMRYAPIPTPPS